MPCRSHRDGALTIYILTLHDSLRARFAPASSEQILLYRRTRSIAGGLARFARCVTHDHGGSEHGTNTGTRAAPKNQRQPSYYIYTISNSRRDYYSVLDGALYTCISRVGDVAIFFMRFCYVVRTTNLMKHIPKWYLYGHSNKLLKQGTFSLPPCML